MRLTYPEDQSPWAAVIEAVKTAVRRVCSILRGHWQWPAFAAVVGLAVLSWQIYVWEAGSGRLEVVVDGALFTLQGEWKHEWVELSVTNPGRVKTSIRQAFLRCGESLHVLDPASLLEQGDWPRVTIDWESDTEIRVPYDWPSATALAKTVDHVDVDGGTVKAVYLWRAHMWRGGEYPPRLPCRVQLIDPGGKGGVLDLTAYKYPLEKK